MRKYEFTGEVNSAGLKRIRAVRDIPRYAVKAGDLGGFLESEDNLSHEGDCWVGDNAWVSDNAWIYGNAHVNGTCWIFGSAGVGGNAQVSENVLVLGNALVVGNAQVRGDTRIGGSTYVFGNAQVSSPYDLFTFTLANINVTYIRGGYLTIGCQSRHIDDSFWDISDEDILVRFGEDYLRFVQAHGETILDMCIHLEEQTNDQEKYRK